MPFSYYIKAENLSLLYSKLYGSVPELQALLSLPELDENFQNVNSMVVRLNTPIGSIPISATYR